MARKLRTFEEQLKQLRYTCGLTQQALADMMDVSGSYISQIISRGPTAEQIEKIATALDVEPSVFDVYHSLALSKRLEEHDPASIAVMGLMAQYHALPKGDRAGFLHVLERLGQG
jgi:transcriptional regulator with XRE-family HTH domain